MRYVVLHHTGIEQAHYDLMVETSPGSMLASWRLPNWPPKAGDEITPIAEHRRKYLVYEGEISGGRGNVRRVAGGECEIAGARADAMILLLDNLILRCPRQFV